MKRIVVILAIMLILGTVFISGCTTQSNTQNNTGGNSQNSSGSGIPKYSIGQICTVEQVNSEINLESSGSG